MSWAYADLALLSSAVTVSDVIFALRRVSSSPLFSNLITEELQLTDEFLYLHSSGDQSTALEM